MSFDVWLLAGLSAMRPTALAAVYALLLTRTPRRALTAFIVAGLVFSVSTGVIIVVAFHGAHSSLGGSAFTYVMYIVLGAAALGFAAGVSRQRIVPRQKPRPAGQSSAITERLRNPSLKMAAAAGIATHLPGVMYLIGLNSIVSDGDAGALGGAGKVIVFNLVWWSTAVAVLVMFILRPEGTRVTLGRVNAWGLANDQRIITVLFSMAGAYFVSRGIMGLAG